MKFKQFLSEQQSNLICYHRTDEKGLIGVISSGKFNLGQGNYGLAVYLTKDLPIDGRTSLGVYSIICNVDTSNFELNADPGDYSRGNPNKVSGFTFVNYDTTDAPNWVVVFDPNTIKITGFIKEGKNFPASIYGLKMAGIQVNQPLKFIDPTPEIDMKNKKIGDQVRRDIENKYKLRQQAELEKKQV